MSATESFNDLCRTWWGFVCDRAESALASREDAQDVAQRIFTRLWSTGQWREIQRPRRFFREAARREALTLLRTRRRDPTHPLTPRLATVLRYLGPRPDEVVSRAREAEMVSAVIGELPPRCRLVCTLVFLEGLTHAEAAERLGVKPAAVEKQVARGRRRLREILSGSGRQVSTFRDGGG